MVLATVHALCPCDNRLPNWSFFIVEPINGHRVQCSMMSRPALALYCISALEFDVRRSEAKVRRLLSRRTMTNRASLPSYHTRRYVGLFGQVFRQELFLQRVAHCAEQEFHKTEKNYQNYRSDQISMECTSCQRVQSGRASGTLLALNSCPGYYFVRVS